MNARTKLTRKIWFPGMICLLLPLLLTACGRWKIEMVPLDVPMGTASSMPTSDTPRPTVTPLGVESAPATKPSQMVNVAAIKTQAARDVIVQLTASAPATTSAAVTSLTPAPFITKATARLTDTPIPPTAIPRPTATLIPPTSTSASPSELTANVTQGPALQFPRMIHTATRLRDGNILIVGGSRTTAQFLADVEVFDPATGISRRVASLHTPRYAHTATLLPDGRVLVVGGYNLPTQWLVDAEVYDPAADTWTVVPPLYPHGNDHTATLMKDGRVLIVGGGIGDSVHTERVEIFDPLHNTWTEAQPLESDRYAHTAQLLDDGRVLIAGGVAARGAPNRGDALLYDPQANAWTATGPMVKPRLFGESVRLPDGRVLVTGGPSVESRASLKILASAEIYDPVSNAWTAAANPSEARYQHALVLLPDGQILAIGGMRDWGCCWTDNSYVREIESYDPVANRWRIVGKLPQPRADAAVTPLLDGRVWVTGGRYMDTPSSDTWLIGLATP